MIIIYFIPLEYKKRRLHSLEVDLKFKQFQNIPLLKPIKEALSKRELFTKSLFSRPESLSRLLPYDGFIEEENIFQLKDGSLGAVFEIDLLEHEPMTEAQVFKAVSSTKSWFSLPENCVLQVLYEQSSYSHFDKKIQSIEESYREAHPVSQILFSEKMKALKESCKKSLKESYKEEVKSHHLGETPVSSKSTKHSQSQSSALPNTASPLKRRTLLSIRYFPENKTKVRFKDYLHRGEDLLHKGMRHFVYELRTFGHLLKNIQSNSEIGLKPLGGAEVLNELRRFFNPRSYYEREFVPYNHGDSLSNQFLFNSPELDYSGIEREGVKTKTLSLKTSPLYAYDGGMAYFVSLNFPFKLSLNFSFPSKTKANQFFGIKEFFLENTLSAKGMIQKEEIKKIQEKLARDDRCLHMTFNVIIEGESDEELEERTRKICHIFHNKLECEIIEEDDIGLGLCLNSLPMNYTPDADYSTQRAIRILRSDAMRFLPIFDSFRGLKNPLSVFLSRENNIVPFSLTENETSNHTVVLADTGSGKSAFISECLQAAKRLSPEPLIFIIDKKSSYSMLSEFYGGELTIFDRNQDLPFSPFKGIYDEEKIAFLTKLISLSIQLTSPSFELESEHQIAITRALKLAYLKKCEGQGLSYVDGELLKKDTNGKIEISMEDFVIELGSLVDDGRGQMKKVVEPLLSKLKPFYGEGIYTKFFQGGPSEVISKGSRSHGNQSHANLSHNQPHAKHSHGSQPHDNQPHEGDSRGSQHYENHHCELSSPNKLFYVYDLDALDSDPILQTLMTMSVIEEIRSILSLPENQGRTGFLVMEEFAMLGRNNPAFRDFAIDFAETMRKRGCWLITLTPRPQNYFELEVGKAFWGVADNFIFLQMSSDNVDFISKHSSLFDEANREIVRSLRTKNGQYADVFYMNKKKIKQGAFRYRQTPLDRWMSPTNALDVREALKALHSHDNKWETLRFLAKTFPSVS